MHSKGQRIAAWIGIILLFSLYIATLVFAIFDFDGKGMLLRTSLIATVAVPILIWVYIWIYGILTQKHTIASVDYDFTAGMSESEREDKTESENKTETDIK
ncbi:MAG: hypothetical protein IIX48_03335 [Lachnospiraceae bacterium]|nr:hypothetical protein [Lachnospiraceae bacterium]